MSLSDASIESHLRARAGQLWTDFGHPTNEFIRLNEQWYARQRERFTRNSELSGTAPEMGLVHPRIYEIQHWITTRLPRRPTEIGHPLIMDMNIHTYWHMVIEAAKRFSQDDPNQCALAAEVLYLRNVTLEHIFGDEVVPAYASNGQKVWADLPYFYDDLQATLKSSQIRDQRINLAAFTARLASLGLFDRKLFALCLLLFRDALETPCPLLSSTTSNETSVQDLLPAVNCWMYLTRHRIEALLRESFDDFEVAVSNPGPLAPRGCPSGFNLIRWKFWGQRLEGLNKSNNEDVADTAQAVLTWWRLIDSHTLGGDDPEEEVKPGRFWASGESK